MAMKQEHAAAGFYSRLQLGQRFAILGTLSAILTLVPCFFFYLGQQALIDQANRAQQGLKPARALLALADALPRHRGSATGWLSGNDALAGEERASKALVAQRVAAVDAVAAELDDPDLTKTWAEIKREWPALAQSAENRAVNVIQNFDAHTRLIEKALSLLERVEDHYGLAAGADTEAASLARAVFEDGPRLCEYLGQTRSFGTILLTRTGKSLAAGAGVITLPERARLGAMAGLAREHLERTGRDLGKAGGGAVAVRQAATQATALVNQALAMAETEILKSDNPQFPALDYYNHFTTALDQTYKWLDDAVTVLDGALTQRIDDLHRTQFAIAGGIVALLILGSLVLLGVAKSITAPINHLVKVMDRLASGDVHVRARLASEDEIGRLGRQFDMMIDQRETVSARTQRENDELNNSIIELLQAVARLAQRDLTVRVPVAEDITGPVGDALNMLSEETAKVLNRVTEIANNVAWVSQEVRSQSTAIIGVASEEKQEVEQTARELNQASEVMQEIAQLARTCNEVAERAIRTTEHAQETVLGTVQGITTIRDTIRETEKRIKRLGERSQEIGGVVSLINSIAERTHILALNAAMHAASAGEAGRGFAVVANEVQRLAENAREATSKIAGLVSNIQVETADTVTTMNEAISQVVRGTELAQQAGGEMRQTRDTTADLVHLVQRIAAGSTAQAQVTQQLRERAMQIQKSSERTYEELRAQGQRTEQLVDFADGLVASVGVFQLPKGA